MLYGMMRKISLFLLREIYIFPTNSKLSHSKAFFMDLPQIRCILSKKDLSGWNSCSALPWPSKQPMNREEADSGNTSMNLISLSSSEVSA